MAVGSQELIVEVTPDGEITGPVDRQAAHDEHRPHVVTSAWLKMAGTENWLLQVRSMLKAQYPGYLSATAAGHVQYQKNVTLDDMVRKTATDELWEEVGLTTALTFVGAVFVDSESEAQWVHVFVGEALSLPRSLQKDEVEAIRVMAVPEILQIVAEGKVTPFTKAAIEMLITQGIMKKESE